MLLFRLWVACLIINKKHLLCRTRNGWTWCYHVKADYALRPWTVSTDRKFLYETRVRPWRTSCAGSLIEINICKSRFLFHRVTVFDRDGITDDSPVTRDKAAWQYPCTGTLSMRAIFHYLSTLQSSTVRCRYSFSRFKKSQARNRQHNVSTIRGLPARPLSRGPLPPPSPPLGDTPPLLTVNLLSLLSLVFFSIKDFFNK